MDRHLGWVLATGLALGCARAKDRDDAGDPGDSGDSELDTGEGRDLAERLALVEGMTVAERASPGSDRVFEPVYEQPVSHDDPGGPTFEQHLTRPPRGPSRRAPRRGGEEVLGRIE